MDRRQPSWVGLAVYFGLVALLVWLTFPTALREVSAQAPTSFTQVLLPRLDVFQAKSQTYSLVAAPAAGTAVMVFHNGLLMLGGLDYTLVGNTLTFTGQEVGEAPVMQVMYWSVGR